MDDKDFRRIGNAIKSKHIGWDDIQEMYKEAKRLREENKKLTICEWCDKALFEPKCRICNDDS